MMRISLTARLSLLFMLAVTAVLVLAGLSFNHLSQHHFLQLDRQTLAEKLSATRNILGQLDDLQQFDRLRPQLRTLLGAHRDITALILDAAGQPLFAEPGPLPVPAALANSTSTEVWQWQHHDRKRPARPPFARTPRPASCAFSSRGFIWKRCTRGARPGLSTSRPGGTAG